MPLFERYIGIDYSGAKTPISSLKGLRVYEADRLLPPREIKPPPSPRKYWTRRGIAEWLSEQLSRTKPALGRTRQGPSPGAACAPTPCH
jgi:hypothetical protein